MQDNTQIYALVLTCDHSTLICTGTCIEDCPDEQFLQTLCLSVDMLKFSRKTFYLAPAFNSQMTLRATNKTTVDYDTRPSQTLCHVLSPLITGRTPGLRNNPTTLDSKSLVHRQVYTPRLQVFVYWLWVLTCLTLVVCWIPDHFLLPIPDVLPSVMDLLASFNKTPLYLHRCPYLLPWELVSTMTSCIFKTFFKTVKQRRNVSL